MLIHKTVNNGAKPRSMKETTDDQRTASKSDALDHVPHHPMATARPHGECST
jgi:hypothetical protein